MKELDKAIQALKPCPFCGNEDVKVYTNQWKNTKSSKTYVSCFLCGANGGECIQRNPNKLGIINATELWNTRAILWS